MTLNKSPLLGPKYHTDGEQGEENLYFGETVTPSAPFEDEDVAAAILAPDISYPVEPSAPTEDQVLASSSESSGLQVQDPTRTAAVNSEADVLAEAAAAQAREQGVALIRDHLDSYLVQNPDASYVTWIATLHPENAEVTIDPRFLIPGNPWATVFAEAQAAAWYGVAFDESTVHQQEQEQDNHPENPSAHTAVTTSTNTTIKHPQSNDANTDTATSTTNGPCCAGGLIPTLVGFSIVLSAIMVAFSLQIASTILYLLAVICANICRILPPVSLCTAPLYFLPVLLLVIFQGLDVLLLIMDTLLVEVLALLNYVMTTPLAFQHAVGVFYHQLTRRLPHYVRWACRKPFQGCTTPPRAACTFGVPVGRRISSSTALEEEEQQDQEEQPVTRNGFRPVAQDEESSLSSGGIPW